MSRLALRGLTKSFDGQQVLHGVDLDVPAGSLTAVLGPSGCGKTTLLRLVAGFDRPDAGTITIGERLVCSQHRVLAPERRSVGYVAQEGALFPHLSVARNIGFGLRHTARQRRQRRIAELIELVGLPADYGRRYPHQLSGGQQQRVALARALAPEPAVVLLDEPFAALDPGLRADTRLAVLAALAGTGSTAVLVTHDQAEALSVADQVAVMRSGRLVQTAPPIEVYQAPADVWVAGFVGEATLLAGHVQGGQGRCALGTVAVRAEFTGPAQLMLRPDQLRLTTDSAPDTAGTPGLVEACTYYGHDATVTVRLLTTDDLVTVRCSGRSVPRSGDRVAVSFDGVAVCYPLDAS